MLNRSQLTTCVNQLAETKVQYPVLALVSFSYLWSGFQIAVRQGQFPVV